MADFVVVGGGRIEGETTVQGSKNAALPILAAAYLCEGEVRLNNCPRLSDVDVSLDILRSLGCRAQRADGCVQVFAAGGTGNEIADGMMRKLRSSVIFLGAMLAKTGEATVSYPGGCALGSRPIDLHLYGLRKLGAQIDESGGKIRCKAPKGLTGANISLSFPSVGATENIMIAATAARGETVISNAAREPEIAALADFLNASGACVSPESDTVRIRGTGRLTGCEYTVIPDRIAAATVLCAAAVSGGEVLIKGARGGDMEAVLDVLTECGGRVFSGTGGIYAAFGKRPKPVSLLRTMPYPGFPTDAQPLLTAVACYAEGTTVVVESIFENRYKYVAELERMGADVRVFGRMAVVGGRERLSGAITEMGDLRGGAAIVIAALGADGQSVIHNTAYIDRGYEQLEQTLAGLGADIKRVNG